MQEYNNISDGDLNPEVQLELEKLNTSSAQINELENHLQDLRNVYYETLSKCTQHLTDLSNKIGPSISRVRPFFDLKRQQIEIQKESQIAASRYEAACVQMSHADAVVSKSEALASESSKLDDSTMEILNVAISKVNISKLKKNEAHKEHQYYLNLYMEIDEKIHQLEKRHKNDIKRSKAYFNYSKYMEEKLKESKMNIDVYEDKVRICKIIYNEALQRLEDISNNIHLNRTKNDLLGPRGEGVGAEYSNTNETYFNPVSQSKISETNTQTDNSLSLVTSLSLQQETNKLCNNKKKVNLVSSTPIVDNLLKVVSSNYAIYFSHSVEQLHCTPDLTVHSNNHVSESYLENIDLSGHDYVSLKCDTLN